MVRQWLVELLDFSAEGLENQVLASHSAGAEPLLGGSWPYP